MPEKRTHPSIAIITRTVVCIGLLIVGVVIFIVLRMQSAAPPRRPASAQAQSVIVMEARSVLVQRTWTGFGAARAMNSADVPARITATVVEVPAEILEGVHVEAGQLLARLDESDFVRQVEIAQQSIEDLNAQLARLEFEGTSWQERLRLARQMEELSRAELQRVEDAFGRDVAKQREVDIARQSLINVERERVTTEEEVRKIPPRRNALEAQLTSQRSTLRLASQNVERTRIVSPIAGTLEEVDIEIGENVISGERIARVIDLSRIEVPLRLPAVARTYIRRGDPVVLEPAGTGDLQWRGAVARLSPTDDDATRTLTAYVELAQNPDDGREHALLPPGRYVRGAVLSGQNEERWVVPRRSLREGRVLTAEAGILHALPVEIAYYVQAAFPALGIDDNEWVVLTEPLPRGALIVVDASPSLVPGRVVTPVRAEQTLTTDGWDADGGIIPEQVNSEGGAVP